MWRAPYVVVFLLLGLFYAFLIRKLDLLPARAETIPATRSDQQADAEKGAALTDAVRDGHLARVRALLAAGADPNWSHGDPLLAATVTRNTAAFDLLLQAGGRPDCPTLYGAVAAKNAAMVTRLLALHVSPNEGTCSALRRAVQDNQLGLARLLLATGADIHARIAPGDSSDEPIEIARKAGNPAMLQALAQGR